MKKYIYIYIFFVIFFSFLYLGKSYFEMIKNNQNGYDEIKTQISQKYDYLINKKEELEIAKNNFLLNGKNKNIQEKNIVLNNFSLNQEEIYNKIKEIYFNYKENLQEKNNLFLEEGKYIFGKNLILSIPIINLNINLISLNGKDIKSENFISELDKELINGAIRYPNKDIIEDGITLIYAHSSQPFWTKFNYSYFRKIPILIFGDSIKINSENKEYNYRVIKSIEIETSEISKYQQFYDFDSIKNGKKYIMLITCYPLDTTKKRWIVIGELEKK